MEITGTTPESPGGTPDGQHGLTPGQARMKAAHDARRRQSEEKWAQHLRDRGWAVIDPEIARALLEGGTDHVHGDGCWWCDGYRAALLDVMGGTLDPRNPDHGAAG